VSRLSLPPRSERRRRSMECGRTTWLVPTNELSTEDAVQRIALAWSNGYESALRDVRKSLRKKP
jgi:hypothetical protein